LQEGSGFCRGQFHQPKEEEVNPPVVQNLVYSPKKQKLSLINE
jgi:hypothetical protein